MAYNSTSWSADSLTKASSATSTDLNATIGGTLTVAGASQLNSTLTVGVDDTGYDVKLFGATSGKYMLWDESADSLVLNNGSTTNNSLLHFLSSGNYKIKFEYTGQETFGLTHGVSGMYWDKDGTNLLGFTQNHDVTIYNSAGTPYVNFDGTSGATALQLTGTLTVGEDDTGHDVIFYGATTGAYLKWDQTNDELELVGAADPGSRLTITGAQDPGIKITSSDAGSAIDIRDNNSSEMAGIATYGASGSTNDRLELKTNNIVRLTVNERGTGIGTNSFVAASTNQLAIANGTSPGAHTDDQIYIGAKNSAGTGTDTLSTLQLFFEEGVDATALDAVGTLTTRIPIWINDVCYWLYLDPV